MTNWLSSKIIFVFLPIPGYLHDESVERYMQHKFLSLCTKCREISSLIVQIKTNMHENLQDHPINVGFKSAV